MTVMTDDERDRWAFEIRAAFRDETWFTAGLFRLIAKADRVNIERIRLGFPNEVAAWEAFKRGEIKT